ncbi:MAG: hypothetical protein P8163_10840 [Candidatus Thiodiazotropha sp.]
MTFFSDLSEIYNIPIFSKSKLLNRLRLEWKKPSDKWRDFNKIETFLKLTEAYHKHGVIDDKTWHDLGMNAIFSRIDTTLTEFGQQLLYQKMHLLEADKISLKSQYDLARKIQGDQNLREQLQTSLYPLSLLSVTSTVKSLFGRFDFTSLPKSPVIGWFAISIAILIFSIIFQNTTSYIFTVLVIFTNLFVVRPRLLNATERNAYALHCMHKMLSVSHAIAKNKYFSTIHLCSSLKHHLSSIRSMKWRLSLLIISQSSDNLLVSYPLYLINLFIPIDALIYVFLIKYIDNNPSILKLSFRSVGELDAIIALGSYINRYPNHCNPNITHTKNLDLKNAYHPLVDYYVANSFNTSGESSLITGSNMAGKTTFIRTIGINIVLSRTLWLCHADSAEIPIINVSSSISNTDFLEDGKSYYFTELENINKFLHFTQSDKQYLFLIDEIFRGTNTVERIAGAAAVLQALAVKDIVLVTTHDIELERFLREKYVMWHFQETGKKEKPFDYKIRPGVCRTKNAIKLMKNMGYPDYIINRANDFANQMEQQHTAPS